MSSKQSITNNNIIDNYKQEVLKIAIKREKQNKS